MATTYPRSAAGSTTATPGRIPRSRRLAPRFLPAYSDGVVLWRGPPGIGSPAGPLGPGSESEARYRLPGRGRPHVVRPDEREWTRPIGQHRGAAAAGCRRRAAREPVAGDVVESRVGDLVRPGARHEPRHVVVVRQ